MISDCTGIYSRLSVCAEVTFDDVVMLFRFHLNLIEHLGHNFKSFNYLALDILCLKLTRKDILILKALTLEKRSYRHVDRDLQQVPSL